MNNKIEFNRTVVAPFTFAILIACQSVVDRRVE